MLAGCCAASSTVIGQIHRDFLPITGSSWYLNYFSSEADKSAFRVNLSESVVFDCTEQIKQLGFKASPHSLLLEVMCLDIVKETPGSLTLVTLLLHVAAEPHVQLCNSQP